MKSAKLCKYFAKLRPVSAGLGWGLNCRWNDCAEISPAQARARSPEHLVNAASQQPLATAGAGEDVLTSELGLTLSVCDVSL